jgi:hypothetical protein
VCGIFVFDAIFPRPSFFHSLFLSCFKNELKAIVLAWCLDNENVIHKYIAEMRRLDRDDIPFLLVVQLRANTLDWWPYVGNFISLDTHDHDRSAHNETSYPSTNPLRILSFYSCRSPLFL